MISQAAIDAVTDSTNMSSFGDASAGVQAVRADDVVAELRRIDGLGAGEARRLGREAIAHVGGHIEPRVRRGGLAAGRYRSRHEEIWWVPRSAIRS